MERVPKWGAWGEEESGRKEREETRWAAVCSHSIPDLFYPP
jgi:hypothetical protein